MTAPPGYRWVEHTAELELAIAAPTVEDVFAQALRAFAELAAADDAGPGAVEDAGETRNIRLAADDPAALLAAWIDELEFLAETEDLVPDELMRLELRPAGIDATVRFRRGHPRSVVKAVTYHRLSLAAAPDGPGFTATVILDV